MIKGKGQEKSLYTTREAADLLGVTGRTIQMWSDSGVIEVWRTPGGHRRIRAEELQRLMGELEGGDKAEGSVNDLLQVLVVEDDLDLCKLYRMSIEAWDLPVELEVVTDGYEALILIGKSAPDIIISDLHMEYVDGFHMISVLEGRAELQWTDLVVVTGLSDREVQERGGVPERCHLFPKPVPFDELKHIVSQRIGAMG